MWGSTDVLGVSDVAEVETVCEHDCVSVVSVMFESIDVGCVGSVESVCSVAVCDPRVFWIGARLVGLYWL